MNATIKNQAMNNMVLKAAIYATITLSPTWINARQIAKILNMEASSEVLECVDYAAFELYEEGKVGYVQLDSERRRYGI